MDDILEGIPIGKKFRSHFGRTISEGDFSLLVNLNWMNSTLHVDKEYMKSTQFGERLLPAPCILSITMGLVHMTDYSQPFDDCGLRLVAIVGFENVSFSAPVHPGDTLTLESEILGVRHTSKPNRSLARIRDITYKQTGEKVMESIRVQIYELVS